MARCRISTRLARHYFGHPIPPAEALLAARRPIEIPSPRKHKLVSFPFNFNAHLLNSSVPVVFTLAILMVQGQFTQIIQVALARFVLIPI